jgi:alpha-tubulin suppressor-like RCC1 family protein
MRWIAWLSMVALVAACGDDDGTDTDTDAFVEVDMGSPDDDDMGPPDLGTDAFVPSCTEGCDIVAVSAGGAFSCALRENGEVLCWGANLYGQLGDGSMRHGDPCGTTGVNPPDCSATPVSVSLVTADSIESESAATCAVDGDGTMWCWGLADSIDEGGGERRRLFTPEERTGFTAIDGFGKGSRHTCAIEDSGTAICAGQGESGQLGVGDFVDHPSPLSVTGLTDPLEIASSGDFGCARTATEVLCWGANLGGQLGDDMGHDTCGTGDNTYDCSDDPVVVAFEGDDAAAVTQLALGAAHACALIDDGTVQCWGFNGAGQVGGTPGTDVATPTEIAGLTGVTAIAAGFDNTCAIVDDGGVKCWGANGEGQLGDGEEVGSHTACNNVRGENIDCSPTPIDVALSEGATHIAVGSAHVCAVGESGSVWCWGWNDQRQLGREERTRSTSPIEVTGF